MNDFKLDVTIVLSAEVEEMRSLITQFRDRCIKLPQNIVRDLRRAIAGGASGILKCHRSNAPASRAGKFSLVFKLNDKFRKVMPALRAAANA